jgi:hypothetical protein
MRSTEADTLIDMATIDIVTIDIATSNEAAIPLIAFLMI